MTTDERLAELRRFAAAPTVHRSEWAEDVRFLLAELDAARAKAEKWDRRDVYFAEALLSGRNIDRACERCGGYGSIVYGNTATWRGGIGGNALTAGVCDHCWGSGDADKPWPSWRELDAARARERHALVAGAEALRRIAAATPIGHEDVTKGPSTYTWLCYAASLLMAEAATTPATPLEQELITMRAREAKIRDAATALRIDANRLCDRNLGGTYEEDCRRSIAALDAALAEGENTK